MTFMPNLIIIAQRSTRERNKKYVLQKNESEPPNLITSFDTNLNKSLFKLRPKLSQDRFEFSQWFISY